MAHAAGTSAECVSADDTLLHVQGLERMPGREVGAAQGQHRRLSPAVSHLPSAAEAVQPVLPFPSRSSVPQFPPRWWL